MPERHVGSAGRDSWRSTPKSAGIPEIQALVIGGGPAGSAFARRLAGHGAQVTLLDVPRGRIGETLAPSGSTLLDGLTLTEHLPCPGICSSWASSQLDEHSFLTSPWGSGWCLDRPALDDALLAQAREAGVSIRRPARALSVTRQASRWRVSTDTGDIEADLCIDATGRRGWLLRALGVPRHTLDGQIAIAGEVDRGSADLRLVMEAVEQGWWYTCRLPGDRRSVVFLTDAGSPAARTAKTPDGFAALLGQTRWIQHSLTAPPDTLTGHPAGSARATALSGEGWLAVGDAALSFDPLSGFGVTAAMQSGMHAADAVARGRLDHYTAGLESLWQTYLTRLRGLQAIAATRWPTAPYWTARRDAPLDVPAPNRDAPIGPLAPEPVR